MSAKNKFPEIWAVVKADAYGFGAAKIAKNIEKSVEGFCVATLDEALELRENQIELPILVLSAIRPRDTALAKKHDISLAIPDLEWLKNALSENSKYSLKNLKVHLAVDSGMGRIGVRGADEANEIIKLLGENEMDFAGIFTHFATADEKKKNKKFCEQENKFDEILRQISRKPRYIHSANSAAALWQQGEIRDIVRVGAEIYGLAAGREKLAKNPFELAVALSLESELTQVKLVKNGESIGYGATYKTREKTWIGTIPIGYADGWIREMKGFHVLVDGEFCEIVGRISMDQMTVKLPRKFVSGTKVVLIGRSKNREITVQEVANFRKTIDYEVICGLSERIPREYY